MEKIILIGAGGHCKVVIEIIKEFYEIAGITDSDYSKHGSQYHGISVIGNDEKLRYIYNNGVNRALVTVGSTGNSMLRKKLYEYASCIGFDMVNSVSRSAIVSPSVRTGRGNVVMDGAIIHADSVLGNNTIINTASIIEHDCIIQDHVHISPGAKLAGGVIAGEGSHIGIGATVIQNVKIGKHCIVGAGAVVTGDIPDFSVCVGVPARIIRQNTIEKP
ncbi:MAG: acetyltransferase [Clostridia bacterium]|nr:acetyltransferase [Clostridia bacterium]